MGNVKVSGSLEEVRAKLQSIKGVLDNRVSIGYPIFQPRDQWRYLTVRDNHVCMTCGPLDGQIYRGDYILGDFPYFTIQNKFLISVHNKTVQHSASKCRCKAEWINHHEAVIELIHEEISDAVGAVESKVFTRTPTGL